MKFALVRTYVRTFVCSFVLCTLARAPRVPWIPLIPYSVDDVAKSHETSHFPLACELSATKHFTLRRSHQTFYRFYYCYYLFFYYSQLPCFLFPFVCFSLSGPMVSLQQGMLIVGDLFMIIQANLGNWNLQRKRSSQLFEPVDSWPALKKWAALFTKRRDQEQRTIKSTMETRGTINTLFRVYFFKFEERRNLYLTRHRVQVFLERFQNDDIWLVTNNRDNDFYHELRST